MKIKFIEEIELEILTQNEHTDTFSSKTFLVNDELAVDVVQLNHAFNTAMIIFDNYRMIYGIPQSVFVVIWFEKYLICKKH